MKVGFDIKSLKLGLLPVVAAGLLLLGALVLAWSGWQVFSGNRLQAATGEARHEVAEKLNPLMQTLLDRSGSLKGRVALINAIKAGDPDAARAVVTKAVPGTQAVEIYRTDFAAGYADPAAFGYGKLGLLERALQDGKESLAVVKDAGSPRLGVAVPVVDEGQVLRVVYLRHSLAEVLAAAKDAAPSGAYLALRQGIYNVAESGEIKELKFHAEEDAQAVAGTPLRVVAVAPEAQEGLFGWHGFGEFALAGLLALSGGGLLWWLRRRAGAAVAEPSEALATPTDLTLSEMQSGGHIVAPEGQRGRPRYCRSTGRARHRPGPQHLPRLRHPRRRRADPGRRTSPA